MKMTNVCSGLLTFGFDVSECLLNVSNVCSGLLTFSFDVFQCFMKVENVCSVLLILPTVASWWANLFVAAALLRVAATYCL